RSRPAARSTSPARHAASWARNRTRASRRDERALHPPRSRADEAAMRARGAGTVVSLALSAALGIAGLRSCQPSPPGSPIAPTNVLRNGTAGVCANQQAVVAAGAPDDPVPTVAVPSNLADALDQVDPSAAAALRQATTCPTTQP